eukprot:gb/GECG01008896.1/.p1 GENE.gb/GECG01008896.1/~~gb/GECG01008896.1/.p1  ORF type:complete len:892 (+),score=89.07 gb/GECG01008896.1/:1-2676(+)
MKQSDSKPKRGRRRKPKLSKQQKQLHDAAPRLIDVQQVAQQHTGALESVTQALSASTTRHIEQYNRRNRKRRRKNSPSSTGEGERVLPKPYRDSQRRTTSHQRYVIPWARKASKKPENGASSEELCRKARRKPSSLRQEWDNYAKIVSSEASRDASLAEELVKSVGPVRLPTHYSQSKRMHMSERYGYYLPLRNNNFGLKGAITKSRAGTLVHDESYYHQIEIKGRLRRLVKIFISLTDPNRFDSDNICRVIKERGLVREEQGESESNDDEYEGSFLHRMFSPLALTGRCTVCFTVYAPLKFPKQAISPVKLMWRPRKPRSSVNFDHRYTAMLWVHPLSSATVHRALINASNLLAKDDKMPFEATVRREVLTRFRCVGKTALRTLKQALDISKEKIPVPGTHEDSRIIYTKIQDPRLRRLPSMFTQTGYEVEVVSNDPEKGSFVPVLSPEQLANVSTSGSYPGLSSALPFTEDRNASQGELVGPQVSLGIEQEEWMSARVLWDSQSLSEESNTLLSDDQCHEFRQSEHERLTNSACSIEDVPQRGSGVEGTSTYLAVAVQLMSPRLTLRKQQEVEIICNRDSARILWNALLRHSCQPVGVQQFDYYMAVCQRLSFPRDYVDTPSGHIWWQDRHSEIIRERQKRSKHHRPNFSSFLHVPFHDNGLCDSLLNVIRQRCGDSSRSSKQTPLSIVRGECYLNMLLPVWGKEDAESTPLSQSPWSVLVQCHWKMWSRGNPQEGALICLPTDEDVKCWNIVLGIRKKDRERLLTQNIIGEHLLHWYGPQEPSNGDSTPAREVIGFVTSAGRNPDTCCTQGNAVVPARLFDSAVSSAKTPTDAIINRYLLLKGKTPVVGGSCNARSDRGGTRRLAYVLIRNPTSHQYYPAILIATADN